MRIQWNNCFLCLNDLTSTAGVTRGIPNSTANFKVLLKYLLDTRQKTYEHVLEDIVRQTLECKHERGPLSLPGSAIQLCGKCEQMTAVIAKLHLQLEEVQMKIISGLKAIKGTVLANSKIYGSNEMAKSDLEVFENWLNEQEKIGMRHPLERKVLDSLYAFQTAVLEKDKDSVEIPLIFLNSYAYFNESVALASDVKTEPLDSDLDLLESALMDLRNEDFPTDFDGHSYDEQIHNEHEESVTFPIIKASPISAPRRVKRKRNVVSTKAHKTSKMKVTYKQTHSKKEDSVTSNENTVIKEESHAHDETQFTVTHTRISSEVDVINFNSRSLGRKTRTAASLASQRITEIKYEQEYTKKKPLTKQRRKAGMSEGIRNFDNRKNNRGRKTRALPSFAVKSKVKGCQKNRQRPVYACDNCSYSTISSKRFEVHLLDHETEEKNFTCDKCEGNRSFSGKQFYDFHMASHEGYNKTLCDFCNRLILTVDLVEHMKTHVDKVFPCPNCSHCSSSREKYINHLRAHGAKGKLWCDICDKNFESRHKFLLHLHEVHKVIEKLVCGIGDCKKTFLDPDNLRLHKKVHLQPAICPVCERSFVDAARLRIHSRKHTGEKQYKCGQCTEVFINNANLQRHLIRSHGAKKFKCDKCSNEYSSKPSLLVHMVVHDDSGIPCGFPGCDRKFGNKSLWRRHQSCHMTEKNYICDECGQQLKTGAKLKRHMLIHTGSRNFKCQHCDKAFLLKKYLVNHMRIHTGEKPFICDVCGKAFNQYAALYMHKRKHMGDAAPPVNPEIGRPRVKHQETQPKAYSNFFGNPADAADSHSMESDSLDRTSPTKESKPDISNSENGRDFSLITGFSQHQLQSLNHNSEAVQTVSGISYSNFSRSQNLDAN